MAGIEALAQAWSIHVEKVPLDDGDYTVDHTASMILLDRHGNFRGTFDPTDPSTLQLEKLRLISTL